MARGTAVTVRPTNAGNSTAKRGGHRAAATAGRRVPPAPLTPLYDALARPGIHLVPWKAKPFCGCAAYRPLSVSSEAEDNHEQRVDVFDSSVEAFSFPSMGTLFTYVENDTYHKEAPHDDEGGKAEEEPSTLCTIDMGSNSFHLIVVRATRDGQLQAVDQMKESVRLLEGSKDTQCIRPEAEERAVEALRRMQKVAASRGAPIRAIATSALREAKNGPKIVARMRKELGLEVEVISGPEEARLIYSGVLQGLPVFDKRVLCIDIGGGSTEFCIGHQGRPLYAKSRPLGHLRLKEDCFKQVATTAREIWECQRYIRAELAESRIAEEVAAWGGAECVVGSSGTIEKCAALIAAAKAARDGENGSSPMDASLTPTEILIDDLRALVHSLIMAPTKAERMALPGMQEKREDVITGGALLLLEIFNTLGITKMAVSPTALREGAVIDSLNRMLPSFQPFTDLRSESVAHLAKRFDLEGRATSARHSAKLAEALLHGLWRCADESSLVHELNLRDKELMMAGVHLHQVGLFLGHSGNHKHAYYIVKSSELLLGFQPMELEVIALLTRYHRKKAPSSSSADLKKLPEDIRKKVLLMIGLVRISIALDRRNTASAVKRSDVSRREDGALQITITPSEDAESGEPADISLEAWAAEQELKFLSKRLGQTVMIFSTQSGECWGKGCGKAKHCKVPEAEEEG